MKLYNRMIALLLVFIMCMSYVPAHAHAASVSDLYAVNGTVSLDGTNDGTVTVAISTMDAVGLFCVIGNWALTETSGSNYLELTEIGSDKMNFSSGDNSATIEDGMVWYVDDNFNTDFSANDRVMYATYSVAADTPAGQYTVAFYPDADFGGILDVDFNEWYDAFTFTVTVTTTSEPSCKHDGEYRYDDNEDGSTHTVICDDCGEVVDPAENHFDENENGLCDGCDYEMVEECEHATTEPVSTGNNTHNIVCGDCGVVIENEDCSGGTATCSKKALCAICEATYGDYNKDNHDGDETSGGFFPNNDGTHYEVITCTACGNEVRTVSGPCHGGTATCTQKPVCIDCEAEYGTVADHKVDPSKGTTEAITQPATCTEEGTKVVTSFCSCGYEFTAEVPIPVDSDNHDWDITYTWDGASCTATRSCSREGCEVFEEAVGTITSKVTVEADCVTPEEITYTATFDVEWAEKRTETVTGDVDTTKHADGAETWYGLADDPDKETTHHGVYCDLCDEPWDAENPDEPHVAGEDGYCKCGNFELIIDFNGGKISQTAPDGIDQTLWEELVNEQLGGFDATQQIGFVNGSVYFPDPDNNGLGCVKEGYRFVGLAYDAEGNEPYVDQNIEEPTTLYMVWECTHDESVHEYTYTDNKDGATHTVKCACGETIDEDEPHDFNNADHKCACEQVEKFTVTWTVNGETYDTTTDVEFGAAITAPAYSVPEGYTFSGWTVPEKMPAEDITLDATLTVNTYTVTWTVNGEEYTTTNVEFNAAIAAPEYDAPEGYTFSGWDVPASMPAEDITLDAKLTVNTYTVTWTVNGETYDTTTDVEFGAAVTAPEYEAPEGYTFSGWTVPEKMPAEDITLDATLTLRSFLIDWFVKDWEEVGVNAGFEQTSVPYGETITAPSMTWNKPGYTFTGWQNVPEKMPADNLEIYGEFVVNKHDITWNVDGVTTTEEDVSFGTVITLPEAPSKTGYKFAGWDGYTEGMTMPDKDVTFTAKWEPKTYTVTWTVDGEVYITTDVKFGAAIAAPTENPTKTGHTFSGWKDVPETMPDDENLTIEAEFTVNNYQVKWDANGGAFKLGGIELLSVGSDVPYGSVITFSRYNLPVREGYSFDGWADASGNPLTDETVMDTTDNLTVYYAQWKANSYTLYVYDWMSEATMLDEIQVPYGEKLLDYLKAEKCVDIEVTDGVYTFADFWYLKDGEGYAVEVDAEDVMPADDYTVYAAYVYTGWDFDSFGAQYYVKDELQTGWFEVDGAWYYLDPNNNGYRVEDVARVPYPTEAINGITYGPDAEDLAYWEAHKDTSRYSDATTAMFVFGEDGKFQHDLTGMVFARCYAVNGMIPWHYGLAEVNGEYYYFIGDTSDASFGNSVAMGDITVSRLNGINGVLDEGATYNFAGGKLSGVDGISNGKYYEDSKLMKGNGLTKYGDEYIYVRSTGEIVVNADYYVPVNDLGIVSGMYKFNENGFMVEPKTTDKNGIVDGIYYRDGKPYYAGLIEIDGSMYYINSSYKVVTGTYYVTKTNEEVTGIAKGTKLVFGEDGKLIPPKNGIYEESGKLYYYENDRIMKGAGVVKLTDEDGETFYIYVRSNGQLATGIYWPTTRNDLLDRGAYNWGSDGRYYPSKA